MFWRACPSCQKPAFSWWWLRTKPESEEAITEKRMQRYCIVIFGIFLKGIYYCPHHPKGIGAYQRECDCRKPNPGMLYQAEWDLLQENEEEFLIQSPYRLSRKEREALEQGNKQAERKAWLSHSYMIGDKILDCEAGENFGVQPILLASGYGKEEKKKLEEEGKPCPPYFENLEEAARWIVERELYSLHSAL